MVEVRSLISFSFFFFLFGRKIFDFLIHVCTLSWSGYLLSLGWVFVRVVGDRCVVWPTNLDFCVDWFFCLFFFSFVGEGSFIRRIKVQKRIDPGTALPYVWLTSYRT